MWTKALQVGVISSGLLFIGSAAQATQDWNTSNNSGVANGNQLNAPISVPVNICGIAVGVFGDASAWCQGGATAGTKSDRHAKAKHGWAKKARGYYPLHAATCDFSWFTLNNSGLANGNQAFLPIQAPIDISGNAIAVGGSANASSTGGATASFC